MADDRVLKGSRDLDLGVTTQCDLSKKKMLDPAARTCGGSCRETIG